MRKALESLPWAKQVQVDYEHRQATLRAEPAELDETAILAALDKAGFAGSKVVH